MANPFFNATPAGSQYSTQTFTPGGAQIVSAGGYDVNGLGNGGQGDAMSALLAAAIADKKRRQAQQDAMQREQFQFQMSQQRKAADQADAARAHTAPAAADPGDPMYVSYAGGFNQTGGPVNASGPGPGNYFAGYRPKGSGASSASMGPIGQSRASLSSSEPTSGQQANALGGQYGSGASYKYDLPIWARGLGQGVVN